MNLSEFSATPLPQFTVSRGDVRQLTLNGRFVRGDFRARFFRDAGPVLLMLESLGAGLVRPPGGPVVLDDFERDLSLNSFTYTGSGNVYHFSVSPPAWDALRAWARRPTP